MNNLRSKIRSAIFAFLSLMVLVGNPVWAGENHSDQAPLQSLLAATSDSEEVNDPLEPVNRWIFAFNEFFQDVLLRPLSTLYNEAIPAIARTGIRNFLDNLKSPVTLANNILQGDIDGAVTTLGRFIVNSTVGIAGFADVAADSGLEGRDEDFGQTLGVWGAGEGFYLVLPIFGPSNPRDLVGKFIVDPFFDPLNLYLADADRDEEIWRVRWPMGWSNTPALSRNSIRLKKRRSTTTRRSEAFIGRSGNQKSLTARTLNCRRYLISISAITCLQKTLTSTWPGLIRCVRKSSNTPFDN